MVDASRAKEVSEEYLSSLADLTINSKPLITMLTILAEENLDCAAYIVDTIERQIQTVAPEIKLPILYLIDSIVKNVGQKYKQLFNVKIANIFCDVFSKVNEKVREKMYALRCTWNDVFPQNKLYTLDVKVNHIDPGWPITAKPSVQIGKSPAIHVNPNFFKNKNAQVLTEELQKKQQELLELQKKKQELEQGLNKKTESLRNQQTNRALPPGHAPVPVSSLPRIPKKAQENETRDPRNAKQSRDPRTSQQQVSTNSQPSKTNTVSPSKAKTEKRSQSDQRSRDSARSRDKSRSSGSGGNANSSKNGISVESSPSKRSDKRHNRSPVGRSSKRSREKSPTSLPIVSKQSSSRSKSRSDEPWASKRDKKAGQSSEYKDRNPSPQVIADIDLRLELPTRGKFFV